MGEMYAVSVVLQKKDELSGNIVNSLRFCEAPSEEAALGAILKYVRGEFPGCSILGEMACVCPPKTQAPPAAPREDN